MGWSPTYMVNMSIRLGKTSLNYFENVFTYLKKKSFKKKGKKKKIEKNLSKKMGNENKN